MRELLVNSEPYEGHELLMSQRAHRLLVANESYEYQQN